MRLLMLLVLLTFSGFGGIALFGQISSPNSTAQNQQRNASKPNSPKPWAQKKYQLNSKILLQAGTNRGYLVVHVALAPGCYIYSLTQPGEIPPTKLTVVPSNQFKLLGGFSPDRPAIVAKDPVFKQQVERHYKSVQFFAPIQLLPQTDPKKVSAEVEFGGQVCSVEGICMPINRRKLTSSFAGYFQQNTTHQAKAPASTQFR